MTENNITGPVGFICPKDGSSVQFQYCFERCKDKCYHLPLLYDLAENRTLEDNVRSVTEILGPQQPSRLKRTKAYFYRPETRIWAVFGSGYHSVLEKNIYKCPDGHCAEMRFDVKIGGVILRGTYDYYNGETLVDWKTMKVYSVKKLKCGDWGSTTYGQQINIYRHYGCPEAKNMEISAAVKDWSRAVQAKEGIRPVEKIPVPMMTGKEIEDLVAARLAIHTSPVDIPCTQEELWIVQNPRSIDFGKPLRCLEYCEVSTVCPAYKKWLETHG